MGVNQRGVSQKKESGVITKNINVKVVSKPRERVNHVCVSLNYGVITKNWNKIGVKTKKGLTVYVCPWIMVS